MEGQAGGSCVFAPNPLRIAGAGNCGGYFFRYPMFRFFFFGGISGAMLRDFVEVGNTLLIVVGRGAFFPGTQSFLSILFS